MMKTISISAFLLALAAVPTVAADGCTDLAGQGALCTYEYSGTYGSCDNGYVYGYTNGFVVVNSVGYASAYGYSACGGYPGYYSYQDDGVFVYGYTGATGWYQAGTYAYDYNFFGSEFSGCDTYAYTDATGYTSLADATGNGCPAGATPNPGWGNLLP